MAPTVGEHERDCRRLAQRVVRAFYGSNQAILVDQLVKKAPAVKDEELAGRLGLSARDLAKIAQPLIDAGVVHSYIRNELKEGAVRVTPRVWYYQDLRIFLDVLKWRVFHIRKVMEDKHQDEIAAQGYVCPLCKRAYSLLDIQHCVDFETGAFHCEICGSELVDNDSVTEINSSREQVKRFLEQCKFIIDALQKAEDIVLPTFDIARWLHVNFPLDKTGAPAESAAAPVAGPSAPLNAVTVKLETDADIEARKIKEEEEELVKREQNAQPAWFAKSTLEAGRAATPLAEVELDHEAIVLADDEPLAGDDDLFGYRSAASTPATSLEQLGGADPVKPGKRSREDTSDDDDDGDDVALVGLGVDRGPSRAASDGDSKRLRMTAPSSPAEDAVEIVAGATVPPGAADSDDDDDEDDLFEAVEQSGPRTVNVGGAPVPYDDVAADTIAYRDRMTDEEWTAFLSM